MKHDNSGKPAFVDKQDKAVFERLLSLYKDKGEIFEMTISSRSVGKTSESQMKLWRVILDLMAIESGNDFKTIEETLLTNFSANKEQPETMSNDRFQQLLLYATNFANEFMGINIVLENDKFQIQK